MIAKTLTDRGRDAFGAAVGSNKAALCSAAAADGAGNTIFASNGSARTRLMKYLEITSCCFAELNCQVHIDEKNSTLLGSRTLYCATGRDTAEMGNEEREKNSA